MIAFGPCMSHLVWCWDRYQRALAYPRDLDNETFSRARVHCNLGALLDREVQNDGLDASGPPRDADLPFSHYLQSADHHQDEVQRPKDSDGWPQGPYNVALCYLSQPNAQPYVQRCLASARDNHPQRGWFSVERRLFEQYIDIAVRRNLPRAVVHYAYYLLVKKAEYLKAQKVLSTFAKVLWQTSARRVRLTMLLMMRCGVGGC